jgi:hypothetical protein
MLYSDENRTNTLSGRRHYRVVEEPSYTALTTVQRTKLEPPHLSTNNSSSALVLLTASKGKTLLYPKLLPQSCSRDGALP